MHHTSSMGEGGGGSGSNNNNNTSGGGGNIHYYRGMFGKESRGSAAESRKAAEEKYDSRSVAKARARVTQALMLECEVPPPAYNPEYISLDRHLCTRYIPVRIPFSSLTCGELLRVEDVRTLAFIFRQYNVLLALQEEEDEGGSSGGGGGGGYYGSGGGEGGSARVGLRRRPSSASSSTPASASGTPTSRSPTRARNPNFFGDGLNHSEGAAGRLGVTAAAAGGHGVYEESNRASLQSRAGGIVAGQLPRQVSPTSERPMKQVSFVEEGARQWATPITATSTGPHARTTSNELVGFAKANNALAPSVHERTSSAGSLELRSPLGGSPSISAAVLPAGRAAMSVRGAHPGTREEHYALSVEWLEEVLLDIISTRLEEFYRDPDTSPARVSSAQATAAAGARPASRHTSPERAVVDELVVCDTRPPTGQRTNTATATATATATLPHLGEAATKTRVGLSQDTPAAHPKPASESGVLPMMECSDTAMLNASSTLRPTSATTRLIAAAAAAAAMTTTSAAPARATSPPPLPPTSSQPATTFVNTTNDEENNNNNEEEEDHNKTAALRKAAASPPLQPFSLFDTQSRLSRPQTRHAVLQRCQAELRQWIAALMQPCSAQHQGYKLWARCEQQAQQLRRFHDRYREECSYGSNGSFGATTPCAPRGSNTTTTMSPFAPSLGLMQPTSYGAARSELAEEAGMQDPLAATVTPSSGLRWWLSRPGQRPSWREVLCQPGIWGSRFLTPVQFAPSSAASSSSLQQQMSAAAVQVVAPSAEAGAGRLGGANSSVTSNASSTANVGKPRVSTKAAKGGNAGSKKKKEKAGAGTKKSATAPATAVVAVATRSRSRAAREQEHYYVTWSDIANNLLMQDSSETTHHGLEVTYQRVTTVLLEEDGLAEHAATGGGGNNNNNNNSAARRHGAGPQQALQSIALPSAGALPSQQHRLQSKLLGQGGLIANTLTTTTCARENEGEEDHDDEDDEGDDGGEEGVMQADAQAVSRRRRVLPHSRRQMTHSTASSAADAAGAIRADMELFADELKHLHTQSADHAIVTSAGDILTSSKDGIVKMWSGLTGQFLGNLLNVGTAWVLAMHLLHEDKYVLVATTNAEVTIVEYPTGVLTQKFRGCTTLVAAPQQVWQRGTEYIQRFGMQPGDCGPHRATFKPGTDVEHFRRRHQEAQLTHCATLQPVKPIEGLVSPTAFTMEENTMTSNSNGNSGGEGPHGAQVLCAFGNATGAIGCFDLSQDIRRSGLGPAAAANTSSSPSLSSLSNASGNLNSTLNNTTSGGGGRHTQRVLQLRCCTQAHAPGVTVVGVCISMPYHCVVSCGQDGSVVRTPLLTTQQGSVVIGFGSPQRVPLIVPTRSIRFMVYCPTARVFATAHAERRALLWSVGRTSTELVHQYPQQAHDIISITFVPQRQYIAMLAADRCIRIYDLRGFRPLSVILHSRFAENKVEDLALMTIRCSMEDSDGALAYSWRLNRLVCALRGPVMYERINTNAHHTSEKGNAAQQQQQAQQQQPQQQKAMMVEAEKTRQPVLAALPMAETAAAAANAVARTPAAMEEDHRSSTAAAAPRKPSHTAEGNEATTNDATRPTPSPTQPSPNNNNNADTNTVAAPVRVTHDKGVVDLAVCHARNELHTFSADAWKVWDLSTGTLRHTCELPAQVRRQLPMFRRALVTVCGWSTELQSRLLAGARGGLLITIDAEHRTIVHAERVIDAALMASSHKNNTHSCSCAQKDKDSHTGAMTSRPASARTRPTHRNANLITTPSNTTTNANANANANNNSPMMSSTGDHEGARAGSPTGCHKHLHSHKEELLEQDIAVVVHEANRAVVCGGRICVVRRYSPHSPRPTGEEDFTAMTVRLPARCNTTITACCIVHDTHLCLGTMDTRLLFYRMIDGSAPYLEELLCKPEHSSVPSSSSTPPLTLTTTTSNNGGGEPEIGAVVGLFFLNDQAQNLLLVLLDTGVLQVYSYVRSTTIARLRLYRANECHVRKVVYHRVENALLIGDSLGRLRAYSIAAFLNDRGDFGTTLSPSWTVQAACEEIVALDLVSMPAAASNPTSTNTNNNNGTLSTSGSSGSATRASRCGSVKVVEAAEVVERHNESSNNYRNVKGSQEDATSSNGANAVVVSATSLLSTPRTSKTPSVQSVSMMSPPLSDSPGGNNAANPAMMAAAVSAAGSAVPAMQHYVVVGSLDGNVRLLRLPPQATGTSATAAPTQSATRGMSIQDESTNIIAATTTTAAAAATATTTTNTTASSSADPSLEASERGTSVSRSLTRHHSLTGSLRATPTTNSTSTNKRHSHHGLHRHEGGAAGAMVMAVGLFGRDRWDITDAATYHTTLPTTAQRSAALRHGSERFLNYVLQQAKTRTTHGLSARNAELSREAGNNNNNISSSSTAGAAAGASAAATGAATAAATNALSSATRREAVGSARLVTTAEKARTTFAPSHEKARPGEQKCAIVTTTRSLSQAAEALSTAAAASAASAVPSVTKEHRIYGILPCAHSAGSRPSSSAMSAITTTATTAQIPHGTLMRTQGKAGLMTLTGGLHRAKERNVIGSGFYRRASDAHSVHNVAPQRISVRSRYKVNPLLRAHLDHAEEGGSASVGDVGPNMDLSLTQEHAGSSGKNHVAACLTPRLSSPATTSETAAVAATRAPFFLTGLSTQIEHVLKSPTGRSKEGHTHRSTSPLLDLHSHLRHHKAAIVATAANAPTKDSMTWSSKSVSATLANTRGTSSVVTSVPSSSLPTRVGSKTSVHHAMDTPQLEDTPRNNTNTSNEEQNVAGADLSPARSSSVHVTPLSGTSEQATYSGRNSLLTAPAGKPPLAGPQRLSRSTPDTTRSLSAREPRSSEDNGSRVSLQDSIVTQAPHMGHAPPLMTFPPTLAANKADALAANKADAAATATATRAIAGGGKADAHTVAVAAAAREDVGREGEGGEAAVALAKARRAVVTQRRDALLLAHLTRQLNKLGVVPRAQGTKAGKEKDAKARSNAQSHADSQNDECEDEDNANDEVSFGLDPTALSRVAAQTLKELEGMDTAVPPSQPSQHSAQEGATGASNAEAPPSAREQLRAQLIAIRQRREAESAERRALEARNPSPVNHRYWLPQISARQDIVPLQITLPSTLREDEVARVQLRQLQALCATSVQDGEGPTRTSSNAKTPTAATGTMWGTMDSAGERRGRSALLGLTRTM